MLTDRADLRAARRGTGAALTLLASVVWLTASGCAPGPNAKPQPQASKATGLEPLLAQNDAPPPKAGKEKVVQTSDNIVEIVQYYPSQPWMLDDEGRYVGLKVRVYLRAAESGKGAFGPGTIVAVMNTLTTRPDGTYAREKLYEWTFDEASAEKFRIQTRSPMGFSYGLFLRWPPELKLMGREIQVVLSYQRQAGGPPVNAAGVKFRVPYPGSVPLPDMALPTTQRAGPTGRGAAPPHSAARAPERTTGSVPPGTAAFPPERTAAPMPVAPPSDKGPG